MCTYLVFLTGTPSQVIFLILFFLHLFSSFVFLSHRYSLIVEHDLFFTNLWSFLTVPTARDLTAVSESYSTISTKWKLPEDPENLITGYELTWRMIENDKEENIINAPQQSSGILPPETVSYEIQNLSKRRIFVSKNEVITVERKSFSKWFAG